ncbi:hypothetical protein EUGRSUZ_A01917 [Eucalyptus grandis]|uniref:Uncharacterized protein n=2 Tax=Eucalyptus grandis TaxID=71139 RepID=A0ACC3M4T6_EUCGR|nr:hypothetical protein EUGRSUZ_A01917 [Eucalyptus grandis]
MKKDHEVPLFLRVRVFFLSLGSHVTSKADNISSFARLNPEKFVGLRITCFPGRYHFDSLSKNCYIEKFRNLTPASKSINPF